MFGAAASLKLKDGEGKFKTIAGSLYTLLIIILLAYFFAF